MTESARMLGAGWALALVSFGVGLLCGACFIEPSQPSTFRFECAASADCGEAETCASGLCQQACAGAGASCPSEAPLCINGFCSSICPTDDSVCPDPQECVSLDESSGSGVCTILCAADGDCPEGDVCGAGYCATVCVEDSDCESDEACTLGVCLPGSSGDSGFP